MLANRSDGNDIDGLSSRFLTNHMHSIQYALELAHSLESDARPVNPPG